MESETCAMCAGSGLLNGMNGMNGPIDCQNCQGVGTIPRRDGRGRFMADLPAGLDDVHVDDGPVRCAWCDVDHDAERAAVAARRRAATDGEERP